MAKKTTRTVSKNPVWKGPEVDGITQSLLSKFLGCKERFRLRVIEGLKPHEQFSAALTYGNMWHECEEALAGCKNWKAKLAEYCQELLKEYPQNRADIVKWHAACLTQFPHYIEYWEEHEDVKERKPMLEEYTFCVPYKLPSGRVVKLRGKFDSVDIVGKKVWLQENKTKGQINGDWLSRQLTFDLQTMMYLVCLKQYLRIEKKTFKVAGVRYNVVRRPLSGGKGTIRPRKATKNKPAETQEEYWARLEEYFVEDPSYWFMRWNVEVTNADLTKFKNEFLNPCLEHLCLWYDCVTDGGPNSFLNYRTPYGVNTEIRGGEIEEYLMTGSTSGLRKVENLFPELEQQNASS